MRRTLAVAALAAPLVALSAGTAAANGNAPNWFGLGNGGRFLHMFPYLHQHGPLFNYGPYYGYAPFEPYGPWDAYLRYQGGAYGGGGNTYGWINGWQPGSHAWGHGWNRGCATCGGGHHHHAHAASGCNTCGTAAHAAVTSGPAEQRYTGYGDPAAAAAFYAATPSLIVPVSGTTAP